jgi:hypothetical protein
MACELPFPGPGNRIDRVLATRREPFAGPLTAGPVRQLRPRPRCGDSFDPPGVGTLTLPPASPPHAGRWADSASRRIRSSSSALRPGCSAARAHQVRGLSQLNRYRTPAFRLKPEATNRATRIADEYRWSRATDRSEAGGVRVFDQRFVPPVRLQRPIFASDVRHEP